MVGKDLRDIFRDGNKGINDPRRTVYKADVLMQRFGAFLFARVGFSRSMALSFFEGAGQGMSASMRTRRGFAKVPLNSSSSAASTSFAAQDAQLRSCPHRYLLRLIVPPSIN